jgi:hypothetical protein
MRLRKRVAELEAAVAILTDRLAAHEAARLSTTHPPGDRKPAPGSPILPVSEKYLTSSARYQNRERHRPDDETHPRDQ